MPMVFALVAILVLTGCASAKKEPPAGERTTRKAETGASMPPLSNSSPSASKPKKDAVPDMRERAPSSTSQPRQPAQESTARNEPEQVPLTPSNQSEAGDDVEITARIRRALVGDKTLSFLAKNVMIVTNREHVILQGKVGSQTEAERVKGIAGSMTTRAIEDRLVIAQD